MATYYKYAERDKDAYVDWSVIGKDISDKLLAENKFREDKKAQIDKDTREYSNYLNNPVQGEYTPANEFILDFANTAQQTRLLQDKLLKSGQWTLKQYTIARQNTKDGTDNLFNLAKYYQDNFKSIMTAYNKKEIQAMSISGLASIEGFANFSKSKGVINDVDGTVSMAGVYVDPKTGLKKIDKNIVPTEVMLKSLTTLIPTFQKDEAVANWKKSLGTMVESMYKNATLSGAGTITQLTGAGAISRYPKYAGAITNFNKSLDNSINSMFSNPYNISSVLTENTGKYNDKSYIFDREEAKADPSKILLKIDPTTHLRTLDDTAPHYEAQKKEAMDYMRADMLASVDSEVKITTTSQLQRNDPNVANLKYGADKDKEEKDAVNFGEQTANLISGDKNKAEAAVKYFAGLGIDIRRGATQIEVADKNGNFVAYPYGSKSPDELTKGIVSVLNVNNLDEGLILKNATQFNKNRKINTVDTFVGISQREKPAVVDVPIEYLGVGEDASVEAMKGILPEGFRVESNNTYGDDVLIVAPNKNYMKYDAATLDPKKAKVLKDAIDKFIKENSVSTSNTQGVGGKYNQ
jgi:hypothetical protein